MPSTPERLTSLETRMTLALWLLGLSLTGVFGAVAWAFHISSQITAVRQQLSDGGNKALVAALEQPNSLPQLRADLNLVSAQTRAAAANRDRIDEQKIKALKLAVRVVLQRTPEVVEGWEAASDLMNLSTTSMSPVPKQSCFDKRLPLNFAKFYTPDQPNTLYLKLADCALNLNDVEGLQRSLLTNFIGRVPPPASAISSLTIELKRVEVSGDISRPMIPFAYMILRDCNFQVLASGLPTDKGRLLTASALTAEDTKLITVAPA